MNERMIGTNAWMNKQNNGITEIMVQGMREWNEWMNIRMNGTNEWMNEWKMNEKLMEWTSDWMKE